MQRRFGRRLGRPLRRLLRGGIPPLLIRSNELLSIGNYAEAADGLEQLARAAEVRGDRRGGRRAANLYLEAGRARLMAGQKTQGLELLKSGLNLLAVVGMGIRRARIGGRILEELEASGLVDEARQISAILGIPAQGPGATSAEPAPSKRPPLPTHCPACGAPMRPDEVDWMDEATAECNYCGSPVRGE